ncbi:MAG: PGF-pre-PGF domain-containing protein, partial [Methanosarcina sp.]
LQWYDKEWKPLETKKTGEDKNYVYFEAKTPGYSLFAITNTQQQMNKEENKSQEDVKLQHAVKNQENITLKGAMNGTAEKQNVKTNNVSAIGKVIIAFSLTLFMIVAEILILRKRL